MHDQTKTRAVQVTVVMDSNTANPALQVMPRTKGSPRLMVSSCTARIALIRTSKKVDYQTAKLIS